MYLINFKEKWQNVCIIWKKKENKSEFDLLGQEQIKPELDRVFNSVKETLMYQVSVKLPRPVFSTKNLVKKRFTKML